MLALWTIETFLRPCGDGVLERELEQPAAALAGIDAGGHGDRVRVVVDLDVMLVADVQALEVLAHHHQVDIVEAAAGNQRACRAQVRVQLELLAQPHVRGAIAAAGGSLERSFQRETRPADARDGLRRKRIARGLHALEAGDLARPTRRARRAHRAPRVRESTISGPMPSPGIRVAGIDCVISESLRHGNEFDALSAAEIVPHRARRRRSRAPRRASSPGASPSVRRARSRARAPRSRNAREAPIRRRASPSRARRRTRESWRPGSRGRAGRHRGRSARRRRTGWTGSSSRRILPARRSPRPRSKSHRRSAGCRCRRRRAARPSTCSGRYSSAAQAARRAGDQLGKPGDVGTCRQA